MTWMVTGGAGYIGAHVVEALEAAGQQVVVVDDLSTGDRGRVIGRPLRVGRVHDEGFVAEVIREFEVTGVVHLAAKKQVEESLRDPLRYYYENVEGLRALLQTVTAAGVRSFVFSSSAAVYGAPDSPSVTEDSRCEPVNPYGRSKLIGESMVRDVAAASGLRTACLRYFNVAGSARVELADRGVTNLVPMVFERLAQGRAPLIFGDDYATPDGTCIRDFVHVADIAAAHVAVAAALEDGRAAGLTANIGRGSGVSVREMIEEILTVAGLSEEDWARPSVQARREGDPARVVASAARMATELGWQAQYDMRAIVTSAWTAWTRSRQV